ncbi:MAG: transcription termination/antitermination NusG family protein [Pirellulales bacterium]
MPILPKQCDFYPADLLDLPASQDAGGPEATRWLVFYTLARREKDLMRKLEAAHIPFYGPMIRRRLRSTGGKTRSSYVPLFPGYVFSRVDDEQRRAALATNTIARWIPVGDERMLVSDLRAIRQLIDSDQPLTPEARLEPGQPVRVRTGPLKGIEGVVIRRRGEERLLVAVRFLNQGASIELEDIDLEPL